VGLPHRPTLKLCEKDVAHYCPYCFPTGLLSVVVLVCSFVLLLLSVLFVLCVVVGFALIAGFVFDLFSQYCSTIGVACRDRWLVVVVLCALQFVVLVHFRVRFVLVVVVVAIVLYIVSCFVVCCHLCVVIDCYGHCSCRYSLVDGEGCL
jgi:hypothetical protein